MVIDEEFVVRTDVDRLERERILAVKDDGVRGTIVNGTPVITGGKVRVAVLLRRCAARKRDARAAEPKPQLNTRERFAARLL
jgi:hypothetical protein